MRKIVISEKVKDNPAYKCWRSMKARCLNPKATDYRLYGGAGVTVCERWLSFRNFIEDMGERPGPEYSIDRLKAEKGYEPGNCRWATQTEQNRNKVTNVRYEFRGQHGTIMELVERFGLGIGESTVKERLRHGWTTAAAFGTPVRKRAA